MKISVYYTPESTPDNLIPDCAIVIDVLRATTTINTALANGAKSVKAFSDVDLLLAESNLLPPESRITLGERGGKKVESCDFGNSPLDCTPQTVAGKQLFISTTNGTRALQRVADASTLITGSIINYSAVVTYIQQHNFNTVWLLGSGWEGGYSLEDTVCAGAIASALVDLQHTEAIGNDEVVASIALYQQWKDNLLGLFHLSSHGQRLLKLDLHEDLKYCAEPNRINTFGIQTEKGVLTLGKN